MKILVVDDSPSITSVVGCYATNLQATAIIANDGETALRLFREEQPDIILLDVIMPGMDGFEVARRIRAMEGQNQWTPIIFLSAMTADEDIEAGIAAGGDDYLTKPVSEIIFAAKVRAMQRIFLARESLLLMTRKLDAANQELKRLSAIDGLTGIANRRLFDEHLQREWGRAQRNGTSLALLMCDVDHFKAYNDYYGHQAGDDCLRQVASIVSKACERSTDLAARYGGEEFAVIIPDCQSGGALIVAERLRQTLHQFAIPHDNSPDGFITLSIGLAATQALPGGSPTQLIEQADKALYQAKHEGRNRVCRAAGTGGN
jgi:diguanylate cyclase (GGDEF)-like protein